MFDEAAVTPEVTASADPQEMSTGPGVRQKMKERMSS